MILVTGGAGFIGSHLVEALGKNGYQVRVLDNLSTGKKENLEEAMGNSQFKFPDSKEGFRIAPLGDKGEFIRGDIADLETCRKACQGVSFVFHLAALGSVPRSVEDPITSHRTNATGTLNILQAAKEAKVQRVIYASSSSVYGNISPRPDESMPKSETLPPHPQSPYAATKLMGEQYCRIFSELYGLETVSLRYFNVFGPRQDPQSIYAAVIPKFITALLEGNSPIIYGDGQQSRDFTYVANVVQANLLAMETPGISGRVFNIACGRQITINSLLSSLQKISNRQIAPQYAQPRSGEVRHSLASIDLAKSHLGYTVKIEFEAGLQATWKRFQEKGRMPK
ncbi:MAG: SDR family oxidoreductase [Proteobacteria bacterium]|nr:SDR family oxidoreductase [Pseudomonadota bacterium]